MGLTLQRKSPTPLGHGLPEPEEVFLSWLLSRPSGADLSIAIDVEIDRLDRYRGSHPGPARLAAIFRDARRGLERDADADRAVLQ